MNERSDGDSTLLSLVGLLGAGVILGVLGWPFIRGDVYTGGDMANFHVPFRFYYAECLAVGDDFRWCPYVFTGFDLHGEGQIGMCHPLHWLVYRFLPLASAIALEWLASYVFIFLGTFVFMRGWGLPVAAAVFGALTFTFSGFNVMHFNHINLVVVAGHLPWLLWGIDGTLRSSIPARVAGCRLVVALVITSELLLGHPQALWYTIIMALAYGCFIAVLCRSWKRVPALLVAVVIGGLAGGIQWLPTWDLLTQSTRSSPPPELLAYGSLSPANLVQIGCPYLFFNRCLEGNPEEFVLYPGSLGAVFVLWILLRRKDLGEAGATTAFLLAVSALMLLLAFGEHTPFLSLHNLLPVIGKFRCPGRYVVLIHWTVAVCSAVAFADLCRRTRESVRIAWPRLAPLTLIPVGSLMIAVGTVLWIHLEPDTEFAAIVADPRSIGFLVGPILMATAVGLAVLAARGVRLALWGMMLLAALDQGIYGVGWFYQSPTISLDSLVQGPLPNFIPQERLGNGNKGLGRGMSSIDGFVALFPKRHLSNCPESLRVAGVPTDRPPLPRVRLVTLAVVSTEPDRDLGRIDPETTALVDEELYLPPGRPGHVQRVTDRPGRLVAITHAESRQLLVLAESWHAGWVVRVDERLTRLVRTYGDFMGCVVEAGEHQIEFHYRPASFTWGACLSLVGLIAMGGLLFSLVHRLRSATHLQVPSAPSPGVRHGA